MKKKYRNLKLIIEAPTQEAWDSITSYFGLKWGDNWWVAEKGKTCISLTNRNSYYSTRKYYQTLSTCYDSTYNNHTFLTYEQFKEQYLNKMSGKKKWNSISKDAQEAFIALMDEMEKEDGKIEESKQVTVEGRMPQNLINTMTKRELYNSLPELVGVPLQKGEAPPTDAVNLWCMNEQKPFYVPREVWAKNRIVCPCCKMDNYANYFIKETS